MAVLKENHYSSAKDLLAAVRHVEELEQQLAGTMEQLAAMRQDLQEMRKSPLKSALQKTVHALEEKAEALRGQITVLKENIIEGCKQALAGFKERGTEALDNLAQFFHLREGLVSIQKATESAIQLDSQALKKIEAISLEYHEAGKHLKNVGLTLMGKETIQAAKPMGTLAKAVSAPYKADLTCHLAMRGTIQKALSGLERLEQTVKKPSILQTMQEQVEKVRAEPAKESPPKHAER